MRRAYFEFGWMLAGDGTLQGLSLGYDRCGEHEGGTPRILMELGVTLPKYPLGVSDRTITRTPERLLFLEFSTKPSDRRRKAYPSALLALVSAWDAGKGAHEVVSAHEMRFHRDPTDEKRRPEDDIAATWDASGFAVQVRGAENIERLRNLYQAFQSHDIAVAVPWARSFFRGGLSFVIPSRMPEEAKQALLGEDLARLELHETAAETGIHQVLEAAGRRFYALSPAWFDDKKDEVIYYLNPQQQTKYGSGWYTVEELKAWARDCGPVLRDKALEAYASQPQYYDWPVRLLRGMQAQGIKTRYAEKLVWIDEAKTIPGLRHRASRDTEHLLPSGDYPFDVLMAKYAEPLRTPASEPQQLSNSL